MIRIPYSLQLRHPFVRNLNVLPQLFPRMNCWQIALLAVWGICGTFVLGADSAAPTPTRSPAPAVQDDPLVALVDEAILATKYRHLDFQQHSPWQILHGLLALRKDYTLRNGDEMVNAIDFISNSAKYKGESWFEATPHGGRAHPYNGTPYDFEGHVNQTTAIISMCDLPLTHAFNAAGGKTITMADLVRHAQMNVNTREETAWTLWFLTHYVDQDAEWTNAAGEAWSMERLVKIQTDASPIGAPCGGCHSLFALAYARNAYLQKHRQLRGAWLEGDQKLQQYVSAAKTMQNRDGSFATEFFKAYGFSNEFNVRIKSSGHMLEWLMVALPKRRLEEPWLRAGIQALATDLLRNATQAADCGPLYHSLHALVLYKMRVQPDSRPTAVPEELALRSTPLKSSGPVTLSAPDEESMPKAPDVSVGQTVVQPTPNDDAAPSEKFSPPIKLSPTPSPRPDAVIAQKSAAQGPTPSSSSQSTGKWQPTSPQPKAQMTPPPANSGRFTDRPRRIRRLSNQALEESADEPIEPELDSDAPGELSPVEGAMPIFLQR